MLKLFDSESIRACLHVCTYAFPQHTNAFLHTRTHAHTYTHTHTHRQTDRQPTHARANTNTHTHTHTHKPSARSRTLDALTTGRRGHTTSGLQLAHMKIPCLPRRPLLHDAFHVTLMLRRMCCTLCIRVNKRISAGARCSSKFSARPALDGLSVCAARRMDAAVLSIFAAVSSRNTRSSSTSFATIWWGNRLGS